MNRLKSALSALAVGMLLLVSLDWAASAATGDPMLLGRFNNSGAPTVVTNNGNGPALKLNSRPGAAPLAVNRNTLVPNLNADLVDGKHASALGVNTKVYTTSINKSGYGFTVDLGTVPLGQYLVTLGGVVNGPANSYFYCAVTAASASSSRSAARTWDGGNVYGYHPLGAASQLQVNNGDNVYAWCSGATSGTLSASTYDPFQVSLTKISKRTNGSTVVAKPVAKRPALR